MSNASSRLLLEFNKLLRETNRNEIGAIVDQLCLDDLKPVVELVARARANYLKHAFELAGTHRDGTLPSEDELAVLRKHRAVFHDLLEASQAFETAIQRGYLDVQPRQDRRGD